MNKRNLLIIASALCTTFSVAQVAKKVVVEHFTNSVCSVCASRNPGFFTNLNKQGGVLHLAIYPSSPYSSCKLNQHNKIENDGRTNYYGVYGSTPRLVIQGEVISADTDYSNASLFSSYIAQTSPASIKIIQTKFGNDSIRSTIIIKTEAAHALGNLKLFIALAEDTVFYVSPNGEKKHFDVFRKSLTGTSGVAIILPATVGDSVVYTASSIANAAWNFWRIYTMAILQEDLNKSVVQCEAASASSGGTLNGIKSHTNLLELTTFPNPVTDQLHITLSDPSMAMATLYSINGHLLFKEEFETQLLINVARLPQGQYVLVVVSKMGRVSKLISKQ